MIIAKYWRFQIITFYITIISLILECLFLIDFNSGNDREANIGIHKFLKDNPDITRRDLWITSKLSDNMDKSIVATTDIIERLGCEYLDLLLLHCPVEFQKLKNPNLPSIDYIWKEFESLVELGLVKNIGLIHLIII